MVSTGYAGTGSASPLDWWVKNPCSLTFEISACAEPTPSKISTSPGLTVRVGNLKRLISPLRNLMVHIMLSDPGIGKTEPPSGAKSA